MTVVHVLCICSNLRGSVTKYDLYNEWYMSCIISRTEIRIDLDFLISINIIEKREI